MYQYPYGNTQQLNLDWLLGEWKSFKENILNMIAPEWSDKQTYTAGTIVIYEDALYRAASTPTAGVFDKTQWLLVTLAQLLEEV